MSHVGLHTHKHPLQEGTLKITAWAARVPSAQGRAASELAGTRELKQSLKTFWFGKHFLLKEMLG